MASIIFIIEHLEPEVSKWLLFEYMHASEIVGKEKLWFTNVKRIEDFQKLKTLGRVCLERAFELFPPSKVIVLDPKANLSLKPNDFEGKEAVIIGGILGDHPPKGRTSKLLTATLPGAIVRNIGKVQFSIDGAIYVAKLVSEGTPLEAISVKRGLRIKFDNKGEIYLPYAYPIKNGKPLINPKLIEYLCSEEILEDEEKMLRD
ncbi:MAG: SAM-dependent methyltransferase [Candidatus Bathyarchaeia archaeon]